MTGRQRKQNHRNDLHQPNHAQDKGLMRSQPEFPADRKRQHLVAERSNEATREQQSKIAIPERGVRIMTCLILQSHIHLFVLG
jgi:hypothetical protein